MKTSADGRAFIEAFEGLFLHAYDDGAGHITIGYGHTSEAGPPRVYPHMIITAQQADQILSSDLAGVEANIAHHVKVNLTQEQFDALVSFDFNTGGLDSSSVLRDVNNLHLSEVPGALMMWCHAGGKVMQGLVRRRQAEGEMFSGNVRAALETAGAKVIG